MFDELFQTDGIVLLHEKIKSLVSGNTDYCEYKDEWECFTLEAKKNGAEYDVYVNILDRSERDDIYGNFKMTLNDLIELEKELYEYVQEFPVVE